MIPAESITGNRHDCLLVCVASILELPVSALDYGDVELDWNGAWFQLQQSLRARGWQLVYHELEDEGRPLVDELADVVTEEHARPGYWIAGVTAAAWPAEWSHALVVHNGEVVLYPPTGLPDVPQSELVLRFVFRFAALDPARFTLDAELARRD